MAIYTNVYVFSLLSLFHLRFHLNFIPFAIGTVRTLNLYDHCIRVHSVWYSLLYSILYKTVMSKLIIAHYRKLSRGTTDRERWRATRFRFADYDDFGILTERKQHT